MSAQYRHVVADAEAAEIRDFIERQETKTMKRAAKHIVIQFTVGHKRDEFRMRVGGDIERPTTDELGAPIWIKVPGEEPCGLPSKSALLEAALTKIFADLPPWPADLHGLYPTGVVCLGDKTDIISVDLGNFSS